MTELLDSPTFRPAGFGAPTTPPPLVLGDVLQGVLDQVWLAADAGRATVSGREITASSPREMKRLLAATLYESVHAGIAVRDAPPRLRDPDLERKLAAVVPVRRLRVRLPVLSAAQPVPGADARRVLVGLAGVRVWVPEEDVEPLHGPHQGQAEVVVPAVRPAVSPGFLFVDRSPGAGGPVQRVYVHVISAEHAPPVWRRVLEHLEGTGIPFRAKVLSAKDLYPRRDAIVVYLAQDDPRQSLAVARTLAEAVHDAPGVGAEVSPFTARLAPGVATAAEPHDERRALAGLSFGEHRATVLAGALVDAAAVPADRPARVLAALVDAGIDPSDLSRNVSQQNP